MERINALGRGAQLMLVGGVLLFIDMFFAWQKVDLGPLGDYTRSGWYGAGGVILGILTVILLAWLIVRIASVNMPLPVSTAMAAAVIAVLILIFAIIKFLSIIGDAQTFWAWVGLALAIVIAAGGFMTVQEAGGVDTLRDEATNLGSSMSSGGGGAAAAPAGAAPVAPAAESAPVAEAPQAASSAPAAAPEDATDAAEAAADDAGETPGQQGA
jgi:hypothetical protein